MTMRGKLIDVFDISGRGCVVLVDIENGSCTIDDVLRVGPNRWAVAGIEMINHNADGLQKIAEGWIPPAGILLRDALKADLQPHIGTVVSTDSQQEQTQ